MFENYKDEIVNKIDELEKTIKNTVIYIEDENEREKVKEEILNLATNEESEEENENETTDEEMKENEVQEEDEVSFIEQMNAIIEIQTDIKEQLEMQNKNIVDGNWLLSFVIVFALGLKYFVGEIGKW